MSGRLTNVIAEALALSQMQTWANVAGEGLERFGPNTVRTARDIADAVEAVVLAAIDRNWPCHFWLVDVIDAARSRCPAETPCSNCEDVAPVLRELGLGES